MLYLRLNLGTSVLPSTQVNHEDSALPEQGLPIIGKNRVRKRDPFWLLPAHGELQFNRIRWGLEGEDFAMRHLIILVVHLITTVLRLVRPGGLHAVVAESVLGKHQLLILNRSRLSFAIIHFWEVSPTRIATSTS
jgi:hypothetical protein